MAKPAPPRDGISVAIPIHNAADRLDKFVPAWGDALARLGREYEILAVNDASTDASPEILAKLAAGRVSHLRVLTHDTRKGFGAGLKTALAEARFPLFFYTSPDYPYAPSDLGRLLPRIEVRDEYLNKTPDLINGCRTGRRVPKPVEWFGRGWRLLWRVALGLRLQPAPAWLGYREFGYGLFTGWLFGVPLTDVNSSFKLFRTAFLKRFPIQSDGDFVHTELMAKATFLTSIMDEIPLTPSTAEATVPSRWREMWRLLLNPDFGNPAAAIPGEPPTTPTPEPTPMPPNPDPTPSPLPLTFAPV